MIRVRAAEQRNVIGCLVVLRTDESRQHRRAGDSDAAQSIARASRGSLALSSSGESTLREDRSGRDSAGSRVTAWISKQWIRSVGPVMAATHSEGRHWNTMSVLGPPRSGSKAGD